MASQSELFKKAAECELSMERERDEIRSAAYRLLRDMWIASANESVSMSAGELAHEIAGIDQIQSGFLPDGPAVELNSRSGSKLHGQEQRPPEP